MIKRGKQRRLDTQKIDSYMKIILTGIPTAIALLFGQWVLTWNNWLFVGLIIFLIVFFVVTYFYLTRKVIVV